MLPKEICSEEKVSRKISLERLFKNMLNVTLIYAKNIFKDTYQKVLNISEFQGPEIS